MNEGESSEPAERALTGEERQQEQRFELHREARDHTQEPSTHQPSVEEDAGHELERPCKPMSSHGSYRIAVSHLWLCY